MRRLITWFIVILVVLVAVFYIGGGWYFSGQIASGALDVRHVNELTLDVTDVQAHRVTLEVRDGAEVPALDRDMRYGLVWDGGYGQVYGPPVARRGGAVTRQLKLLEGSEPDVGARARLDRDAFPGDRPSASVGKQVRNIRYSAGGRKFPAWFVPGKENTWVIFVHGAIGADREEPLRAMRVSTRLGMPSLDITYRNDIGAPQDPSGQYQFGRTEWRDLEGAVRYAVGHGAKDVVLAGFSMGGAITAAFLERSELAPKVSRVVLDAPMLDFQTVVEYGASQTSLPVIGEVPDSLIWTAEQFSTLRDGVNWEATDYLDDSSDWLKVPALVFHGDQDLTNPLSLSRRLAAAHPALVTLKVVKGADHVQAWNVDPAAYEQTLAKFLRAGR